MNKAILILYFMSIKLKRTRMKIKKPFHRKKPVGAFITPKDTVDSIMEHPILEEEKARIYVRSKENDIMAIQTLDRFTAGFSKTSGQCYADGLNAIIRNHNKKVRVYRQIYSEEEMRKDPTKEHASLHYFPSEKKSKFIIVCPGGAYVNCEALSEGYPLALHWNSLGYTAFVLSYRVREEAANLAPLADLAAAVTYVLDRAEELNVDTEDYAVLGFSAGGHLVGCFGLDGVGYKNFQLPKPGTIMIAYGLISTEKFPHCNKLLLGPEPDEKAVSAISIDKNITPDYPPVFFWAGKNDLLLDYRFHGDELEKAVKENKVPYEYHLFEKAQHGISLGVGTDAQGWVDMAADFWARNIRK
jgi:acetyl esterase/lipase